MESSEEPAINIWSAPMALLTTSWQDIEPGFAHSTQSELTASSFPPSNLVLSALPSSGAAIPPKLLTAAGRSFSRKGSVLMRVRAYSSPMSYASAPIRSRIRAAMTSVRSFPATSFHQR